MENDQHSNIEKKVLCAVITVSDTRTDNTDKSGRLIIDLLKSDGHQVNEYIIVEDDSGKIRQTVEDVVQRADIEAVLISGGTGISQRDVTIESLQPLFDKTLPGFGELFRCLSYQFDIGSRSLLSRAIAGVANNRVVFSMPGSTGAVKLAMDKLILPELGHAVKEINKDLFSDKEF
ncbi:molybdenum cofactor biosynthesis protein [Oceanobacillus arenosus]|uniref:Molybdenum cofactor biosynthesis protein B n=1 Tax=Oceanobacillus arenosus TaxID=1229153 RepID=A0A3D8PVJ1_9BACI|nr:molybdenum cofactor biosynthesis protein B [Oceanobacillus arenosus]RDW20170.1 molybdenum cofactor biosynthesis protein [Oceanobacillus arenosus]